MTSFCGILDSVKYGVRVFPISNQWEQRWLEIQRQKYDLWTSLLPPPVIHYPLIQMVSAFVCQSETFGNLYVELSYLTSGLSHIKVGTPHSP